VNFAFFPLNNPAIVAIPVAFFLGWLGTVTDRRPADSARFARMQVRALTGGLARTEVIVPDTDSAARGVNAWTCR
jgi:cation/acetate symporter